MTQNQPAGRGRPKGASGKECRTAKVVFRCTPEQKAQLEAFARMHNLGFGEWLRMQFFGERQ